MPRGRLPLLALLLALSPAAACGDRGPPVWGPSPELARGPTDGCMRARKLRERAPGLLDEGRLDRAVRVLQRAEDLCQTEAQTTWALRVRALAALGRAPEALQLAGRIERSDRAGDEERRAAAAARTAAEAHGRTIAERGSRRDAPELFDPNEAHRKEAAALLHQGAEASRAGDHAGARQKFMAAWEAWPPNPLALVEAGLEARLAGARAEAQALWDRAAYDDATLAIRPEIPAGAPPIASAVSLSWSPAGDRIAVGGDDEVEVLDADLHPTLRLRTRESVQAIAFDAGGEFIFAGLDGGAVRVIDTITGTAVRDLPARRGPVRSLAASPDRHTVASGGDDGSVHLYDALAGTLLDTLRSPRPVTALAFDATGAMLASAGDDGRITLWDTRTGALAGKLPARGGAVRAMAFHGDRLDVVTAGERVRWDISKPKAPRPTVLREPAGVAKRARIESASLAAGAGPAVVASVGDGVLDLADFETGAPAGSAQAGERGGLVAFALAPGGQRLAAVYHDRSVAILPVGAGAKPDAGRLLAREGPIDALVTTADGKMLAAAEGGRVLLWRTAGERLRAYDPGDARTVAFSPDGRALAMGLDRARVIVRDLESRRPDVVLETAGPVQCVAFSPDGRRLAAGTSAPSVQLFTAGGGGEPGRLGLMAGPVRAVRFSPDGASVLVASKEGLTMWNPAAHEGLRFTPYGPETRDAVFTPDGTGMAVASIRGELLLGKASAGAPAPVQAVLVPAQIVALAVAADGTLATVEGDRAVTLRAPTGKALQHFHDPEAAMRAVAFLPGHVAVGMADGSVRLFRAPTDGPVGILRPVPGLAAGKLAGIVSGPGGHLDIVGPDAEAARSVVRCRLGATLFPLEVCAEQFAVDGLLPMVLAGKDPAEADP